MDFSALLREIFASEDPQRVVDLLAQVPHYSWVGIYWVREGKLVLGPWRGPKPTEHVVLDIGEGVCGAAAASGQVELVPDVSRDPRYIACFPETKSEIVVPIKRGDEVIGEIDIDSDTEDAFGPEDVEFLKKVAEHLARLASE